jgi:hypothetical protein
MQKRATFFNEVPRVSGKWQMAYEVFKGNRMDSCGLPPEDQMAPGIMMVQN